MAQTAEVDLAKVEAFAGHLVGLMTGSAVIAGVVVGERMGFYRALAAAGGPMSSDALATATGCHPRLVREWLDGQAAAALIAYDPAADTYALGPEAALVLADEDSPAFMAGGSTSFEAMYHAIPKLQRAMKGDGGIAWGDHHESLYEGVARFFRPGYRTHLVDAWIPAMDGVADKLSAGGTIADVGCGFGHSCTVMAEAFPQAEVWGFDFHAPSVEAARANAADLGLGGRVQFDVKSSTSYDGSFDLICFFDCLHDMGDPVGIATHARSRLAPGGSVLLVEPFALDGRAANLAGNPAAGFFYHASTFLCTPSSLAQDVGRGMGAQSGESGMRAVFEESGFGTFRRIHESPFNIVYEAKA
ncbi:MAG: class I SAM-dependent methyltransferase [Acidimicrobiia bacterium]|nr:class I SAM-dependent methyltransferase [Acidimicrobiia bacterium]